MGTGMGPTGTDLIFFLAVVAIAGWAAITLAIKVICWLFSHIMIAFI